MMAQSKVLSQEVERLLDLDRTKKENYKVFREKFWILVDQYTFKKVFLAFVGSLVKGFQKSGQIDVFKGQGLSEEEIAQACVSSAQKLLLEILSS